MARGGGLGKPLCLATPVSFAVGRMRSYDFLVIGREREKAKSMNIFHMIWIIQALLSVSIFPKSL